MADRNGEMEEQDKEEETSGCMDTESAGVELPLFMALYSGNPDLVKLLSNKGCDLYQQDSHGNTAIHILVVMSESRADDAVRMYSALLSCLKTGTNRRKLILSKNHQGQTPLDIAAEMCVPEMLHALFNTNRVYRFPVKHCGNHQHVHYDISKYKNTKVNTVLYNLAFITEQQLVRVDKFKLLEREPFASWLSVNKQSNWPLLLVWMVVWFMVIGLYVTATCIFCIYRQAPTNEYSIFVIVLMAVLLITDIYFLSTYMQPFRILWKRLRRGQTPVAFVPAYRLIQPVFLVSMIIMNALAIENDLNAFYAYITFQTVNMILGIGSILFFIQLDHSLGHYYTVLQKVFCETFSFLLLGCASFLAFGVAFYIVHIDVTNAIRSTNLTAVVDPFDGSFDSLRMSIYETFLLVLGIVAPKDWYFSDSFMPGLAITIYICCLIFNTLIFLNLLIAIMNERVVQIHKLRKSVLTIQILNIYLLAEAFGTPIQAYCKLYKCKVRCWYDHCKLSLIYRDGKVLLQTIEKTLTSECCS